MILLDRKLISSLTSAVRNMRSVPRSTYIAICNYSEVYTRDSMRYTRYDLVSELGRPRSLVVDTSKKRYKSFQWPDGHWLRKLSLVSPPSPCSFSSFCLHFFCHNIFSRFSEKCESNFCLRRHA